MTVTWDFGDGTTREAGTEVSHTYVEPGDYTVSASKPDGRNASTSVTAGGGGSDFHPDWDGTFERDVPLRWWAPEDSLRVDDELAHTGDRSLLIWAPDPAEPTFLVSTGPMGLAGFPPPFPIACRDGDVVTVNLYLWHDLTGVSGIIQVPWLNAEGGPIGVAFLQFSDDTMPADTWSPLTITTTAQPDEHGQTTGDIVGAHVMVQLQGDTGTAVRLDDVTATVQ
jgi:hypothetical protein